VRATLAAQLAVAKVGDRWGWRCPICGAHDGGFVSAYNAQHALRQHEQRLRHEGERPQ
jgi:hypothetical protein